jgi:hypothetical protein
VDAYPTSTFPGEVSTVRLNPTTVSNVVTYQVVNEVSNPDRRLRPGMTANLTIETARATDVLRVPAAALRYRPTNEIFAALGQTAPAPTVMASIAAAPASPPASGHSAPVPTSGSPDDRFAVCAREPPGRAGSGVDVYGSSVDPRAASDRHHRWHVDGRRLRRLPTIRCCRRAARVHGDGSPGCARASQIERRPISTRITALSSAAWRQTPGRIA